MADNVGYTPGSGATVAADDIGGVLYQRIKPVVGADGTAVDVSESNPMPMAAYGELIEAIEALRMAVSGIARNIPVMDTNQRFRVNAEAITTISSVTSLSNVATVTTVSNVLQFGGQSISHLPTAITNAAFLQLRSNITVT